MQPQFRAARDKKKARSEHSGGVERLSSSFTRFGLCFCSRECIQAMINHRARNVRKKSDDGISKLPNDILISIISLLTFREAIATSVLSTRWRDLNTYFTSLDFPPFSGPRSRDRRLMNERLSNYEGMVNRFLDSHKGSRISEFKVDMSDFKGSNFDKWLEFALTKEAEVIHIKMRRKGQIFRLTNPSISNGFKRVKELAFSMVDVTDQEFEILASNCLALESLSIVYPNKLKKVSIVGHPNLKHLDLSHAWEVRTLEIRDVINLVSLKCYELNARCVLQLSDVPSLIKLKFGEDTEGLAHIELLLQLPSAIRDQLQEFSISTCEFLRPIRQHRQLPFIFANLKQIELVFDMTDPPAFRKLYRLIKASPLLEKLVLKFSWKLSDLKLLDMKSLKEDTSRIEFYAWQLSLPNFKELEVVGFFGTPIELKLAFTVIHNATALEKLTVVACDADNTVRRKALASARYYFRKIKSIPIKISII